MPAHRTPTHESMSQRGMSLIFIIGALVALGAIATGVTVFTPSSTLTEVYENNLLQAYYAAYSGIRYSKTLNETAFKDLNTSGATLYDLNNVVSFALTVGTKDATTGKYPVISVGEAFSGTSSAASYILKQNILPVSSVQRPTSLPSGISGQKVYVAGYVGGDVAAEEVTVADGSRITGSLTSLSSTEKMTITGGVNVGGQICSNDGVYISGGSFVANGNVYSHGDVTIDGGATINGNIYSTGNVTITGGSTINGNIYSQGSVDFLNGKMGTKVKKVITRRFIYAMKTVTLTGGNELYIDVHTQKNIVLSNITVHGDAYDLTGLTKLDSWSSLDGNEYHNPTKPLATPDCVDVSKIVMGDFTAEEDGPVAHTDTYFTAGNYYLKSFSTGNWSSDRICFDTSGGDINIFVDADVTTGSNIFVKTSSVNNCFTSQMSGINESYASEASKVFLYTTGKFTILNGANWFGTVLAEGDIQPGSGSNIIGSLHSNDGTINPGNVWYNIKVVDLGP